MRILMWVAIGLGLILVGFGLAILMINIAGYE